MTAESRLIEALQRQAEEWQTLATEARQRADQRRRGDLTRAYLYGRADQLEMSAAAIRDLIARHKLG
jgi:hypothetical protein